MAKSSRSSAIKNNNRALKRKVFGPVETARNERLSAKLLELAQQPKPPGRDMEVEQDAPDSESKAVDHTAEDIEMDADGAATKPATRSNKSLKRAKTANKAKIEKKRHRKTVNRIAFAKHPKKGKIGKKG